VEYNVLTDAKKACQVVLEFHTDDVNKRVVPKRRTKTHNTDNFLATPD
jgi:hypothetical protein